MGERKGLIRDRERHRHSWSRRSLLLSLLFGCIIPASPLPTQEGKKDPAETSKQHTQDRLGTENAALLKLEDRTVRASMPETLTGPTCWIARNFYFENGSVIQTNGHDLVIYVFGNLEVEGEASIRSFDFEQLATEKKIKPPTPQRPNKRGNQPLEGRPGETASGRKGLTGLQGTKGVEGQAGKNAGAIRIHVTGFAKGSLRIQNSGTDGGPGGDGGEGGEGGNGEQGGSAKSKWDSFLGIDYCTCESGPGFGGAGGDGGQGGEVGDGGKPGKGGDANIWILGDTSVFVIKQLDIQAGKDGVPGGPGKGGKPGNPGLGGGGSCGCIGAEIPQTGGFGARGPTGPVTNRSIRIPSAYTNITNFTYYRPVPLKQLNAETSQRKCSDQVASEGLKTEALFKLWGVIGTRFSGTNIVDVTDSGLNRRSRVIVPKLGSMYPRFGQRLRDLTFLFAKEFQNRGINSENGFCDVLGDCCSSRGIPFPDLNCLLSIRWEDDALTISSGLKRVHFSQMLPVFFALELARNSFLLTDAQMKQREILARKDSLLYQWAGPNFGMNFPSGEWLFTIIDDKLIDRLSTATSQLLPRIRSAIGSQSREMDAYICSASGTRAVQWDSAPNTYLPLSVSRGQNADLFAPKPGQKGFGSTMEMRAGPKEIFYRMISGSSPPIGIPDLRLCAFANRVEAEAPNYLACMEKGTELFLDLYPFLNFPNTSLIFFHSIYLQAVWDEFKDEIGK